MPPPAAPRRLDHDSRRWQLTNAAAAIVARRGFAALSLEEVASRAGVTRNLIYHYFPRGRDDVIVAVVQAAEEQLLKDWLAASQPSLEAGLARILDHAQAPTHAWRVHRLARALQAPEITVITESTLDQVLSGLADARRMAETPLGRAGVRGYVAFAETALDEGRRQHLGRDQLIGLLRDVFRALPA